MMALVDIFRYDRISFRQEKNKGMLLEIQMKSLKSPIRKSFDSRTIRVSHDKRHSSLSNTKLDLPNSGEIIKVILNPALENNLLKSPIVRSCPSL